MNQILYQEHQKNTPLQLIKNKKMQTRYYKLLFYFSITVAIILITLLFFNVYNANKKEKLSKELLNRFSITTLYSNLEDTNNSSLQKASIQPSFTNPFVIGLIRIDKINVNYPILSESSKNLLKVSLCRFAGPMPNEIGNFCIAGHNYVDYKFFSRLNELEKNDIIQIYDLYGKKLEYSVYSKYEVLPNDLSCTNQDVGNKRIVTLLTCNNVNGKRTIIKANEKL